MIAVIMRAIFRYCLFIVAAALAPTAFAGVGFFAPAGLPRAVVEHTNIGLISAISVGSLEKKLVLMRGTTFKAYIDVGTIITYPRPAATLNMQYHARSGRVAVKRFKPVAPSYLRAVLTDSSLQRVLEPIVNVLARNKANVDAVFLADEPYVHGISKTEMERAARVVRRLLNKHGLASVKIGVIFASGMFNREFAQHIDREAGRYVQRIDHYYDSHGGGLSSASFATWVKAIEEHRLVTYDGAGNMYMGGGLPRGFDIYGFDFYLSTLLLDGTHEDTLSWFAARYPYIAGCARFAGIPVSRIRTQLSFFRKGEAPTVPKYQDADRGVLDAMFSCRMGATTKMLRKEAKNITAKFLFVAESSDNGVLEFSPAAAPKPVQPEAVVAARVLDEVERAEQFYDRHRCLYSAGLLFFTYQNTYDPAINLYVGGASGMPAVMSSIYSFAEKAESENGKVKCSARPATKAFGAFDKDDDTLRSRSDLLPPPRQPRKLPRQA